MVVNIYQSAICEHSYSVTAKSRSLERRFTVFFNDIMEKERATIKICVYKHKRFSAYRKISSA